MVTSPGKFRVLIADDEDDVRRCYLRAFSAYQERQRLTELEELDARLFNTSRRDTGTGAAFDVVTCSQGDEAVALVRQALADGMAFDVAILDVRMPPGISGVEAGERIRELDSNVILIFVSGFSDVAEEELVRRIAPKSRLVYLTKPLSFRKLVIDVVGMLNPG